MKQILCVTAYKEFEYLKHLCKISSKMGFIVYVHIDKKTCTKEVLKELNGVENVIAFSKYKIPWGALPIYMLC